MHALYVLPADDWANFCDIASACPLDKHNKQARISETLHGKEPTSNCNWLDAHSPNVAGRIVQ